MCGTIRKESLLYYTKYYYSAFTHHFCASKTHVHIDSSYYISSGIKHLPNCPDVIVLVLYAFGGKDPEFSDVNSN